jgi:hypothetical protein
MTYFITRRRFCKPIFGKILIADDIRRNRSAESGFKKVERIADIPTSGIGIDYHSGK